MKFDFKEMYRFLLSQTFPGLLLLTEIVILWEKHHNYSIFYFITPLQRYPVLILLAYAFSTVLGIILDAFQHVAFDFVIGNIYPKWLKELLRNNNDKVKYITMKDNLSIQVYQHFLEDDLWY